MQLVAAERRAGLSGRIQKNDLRGKSASEISRRCSTGLLRDGNILLIHAHRTHPRTGLLGRGSAGPAVLLRLGDRLLAFSFRPRFSGAAEGEMGNKWSVVYSWQVHGRANNNDETRTSCLSSYLRRVPMA